MAVPADYHRSRGVTIVLWALQIVAALAFFSAGFSKLVGAEQMVETFAAIGFGQWFRYLTGAIEVSGAALLLIPPLAVLGALLLLGVMIGAVLTHLLLIGGNPLPALALLVILSVILWLRRAELRRLQRTR